MNQWILSMQYAQNQGDHAKDQIKDVDMLRRFIELQRTNKRKNDYFDGAFRKRLFKK